MWSPDQLRRLSEWAAHMERLRVQYQRNAQVWRVVAWVWFGISQFFTAAALFFSLLQSGPPNGQCNIGPYKVCLSFFYFSIIMMFCAFVVNNVVAYLKPDEQKANCEDVARSLSELITHIGLLRDDPDRKSFFVVASFLNQRFATVVKSAPSLWGRAHLDLAPLPAGDAATPREAQWLAALNYELRRSSIISPAAVAAAQPLSEE